jgi:hypothetical protein
VVDRFLILRRLTGSDLGWFAEARRQSLERGRQRAINFNAAAMAEMFPEHLLAGGRIELVTRRYSDGSTQSREIRKQHKNWRLAGPQVSGVGLEQVREGDLFWAVLDGGEAPPFRMTWDVVTKAAQPELFAELKCMALPLQGGMLVRRLGEPETQALLQALSGTARKQHGEARATGEAHSGTPGLTVSSSGNGTETQDGAPEGARHVRKQAGRGHCRRIHRILHQPHILVEILKSGLTLSAAAQASYLEVLDLLACEMRNLLLEASLICKIDIDQRGTWKQFRGRRIGFIDGGVASPVVPGAAPVAIRVGSYAVIPGQSGQDREHFRFELQFVDDLYESPRTGAGIYEDYFEDVTKLRDAARIACEAAGVISLALSEEPPEIVFLHGPLVNPVSPYASDRDRSLPNFTQAALERLLPHDPSERTGKRANFVTVYRDQLEYLTKWEGLVCGVVERPSSSCPGPMTRAVLETFRSSDIFDAASQRTFEDKIEEFRITDSVIFACALEEGEYVLPVAIDKQGPDHKIPNYWFSEIKSYPKPLVTYAKCSAHTLPVRVESFPARTWPYADLIRLVIHMSRLLPLYAFPVGLDIVDKHARIPNWMTRQLSAELSASLILRAMETGDSALIKGVRRLLGFNPRDWMFRPSYREV